MIDNTQSPTPPAGAAVQRSAMREAGLTPHGRAVLAEIRARNAMVVEIQNESWGAKLTTNQMRAFAEYMRRFSLDVSEIDNLGGRPYRNARYYQRRIAELVAEGRIEWYKGDHIGPDDRLDELEGDGDEWAKTENTRRMQARIRFAVPREATHAYVVTIKMKEVSEPTEGCNFIMPQGSTKKADPIGWGEPVKTVETRAWRRAAKLAAAEIPELKAQEAEMEYEADKTEEIVVSEALAAEASNQAATITPKPLATEGRDPYAEEPTKVHKIGAGAAQPVAVASRGDRISATPEPEPEHVGADFEVRDGHGDDE